MNENIFIPPTVDLLTDVALLKTLREYERTRTHLAARKSPGFARIESQLTEAISLVVAELLRRGRAVA